MTTLPIGLRESQSLEFKARDSLEKPASLAREIVAMLNADPGEIWVGIGEEDGVAVAAQPTPDVERALERLQDHLVEAVEPPLSPDEVRFVPVPVGPLGHVAKIEVRGRRSKRPYAHLKQGGRYYTLRVGARLRPMAREELHGTVAEELPEPLVELRNEKSRILEESRAAFWLGIAFDPSPWTSPLDDLRPFLRDPTASGNRPGGSTVMTPYTTSGHRGGCIWEKTSGAHHLDRTLALCRHGTLTFVAPIEALYQSGTERALSPDAVLELPTSMARLAASLLNTCATPYRGTLFFDLLLTGVEDWELLPFSPRGRDYGVEFHKPNPDAGKPAEDVVTLPTPREFTLSGPPENPDQWAWPLVRWLYEEFGYGERFIPFEFDRATHRLSFGNG